MTNIYGIMAGVLGIIGAFPYIVNTYRRQTKPHTVAWLIFLVLSLVSFASQFKLGAEASLIFIGWTVINNLIIVFLSIGRGGGYGRLSGVNIILFILAIVSIVLWQITSSALVALICVLIAEGIGASLIVVKAYRHPGSETAFMWGTGFVAGILNMLAVGKWEWALLAAPLELTLFSLAIIVAMRLGRHHLQT